MEPSVLFSGDTDQERIRKVRDGEVPPLAERRADLPEALVAAVHKALALEPEQPFETAEAMGRELLRVIGSDPVSPREIGQSVIDARIALGLTARTQRPPPTPVPESRMRC